MKHLAGRSNKPIGRINLKRLQEKVENKGVKHYFAHRLGAGRVKSGQ